MAAVFAGATPGSGDDGFDHDGFLFLRFVQVERVYLRGPPLFQERRLQMEQRPGMAVVTQT